VTPKRSELAPRRARLEDGGEIVLRHARAGDEPGIARLLVEAFPAYVRAARGDRERAARALAREIEVEEFVVAARAESGWIVGTSCLSDAADSSGPPRLARVRRKLSGWGVFGALCFTVEKLRTRLFEPPFRPRPGELYRYNDAVDSRCRSLGVGRHVSDFVDAYARAAGFGAVSAKHHVDNQPVLALQKKRGCTLTSLPLPPLARLLGLRPMVLSTRALDAPAPRTG
jgi:ribosomal protein S18 acetylase RimI-like enzyme